MNKIQSIAQACAVLLAIFLTSCGDYLDNVPKGEKIPTTLEDFSTMMADEYYNLREPAGMALYLIGDQYASTSTLSYSRLCRANYMLDTTINRVTENNSDEDVYYVAYRAINTACLILENVDGATEATDAERSIAAAQAHILRAEAYYRLVNYYAKTYDASTADSDGGVPVISGSEVGASYTQLSVAGVYQYILDDITTALSSLPETSANILYPTLATGYALAARVYLQMGQYEEALRMANQALERNSTLFSWVDFYEENKGVLTTEGSYQRVSSPMGHSFVENYNYVHGTSSYSGGEYSMPLWRADAFEEGDAMFLSRWKQRTMSGDTYYYGMLSGYFGRGSLTTTEVYLIKAECLARTGDVSGAMGLVNEVRQQRILPDVYQPLTASNATEALQHIIKVKTNALVMTFQTFADRRRWNLDSSTATTLSRTIDGETRTLSPDSYLWIMPFPQGAVDNSGNGTITQNVDK